MKKPILLLLMFFYFVGTIIIQAQQSDKQKAIWIVQNFAPSVTWTNEQTINDYTIGVCGKNTKIYEELLILSKTMKIKDKGFTVVRFKKIKDILPTNILFVEAELNGEIKDIFEKLSFNTLLITDQCSNKEYYMINFLQSNNSSRKFEINPENAINAGLKFSNNIIVYGGSEVKIKALYYKTDMELSKEKRSRNYVGNNISNNSYYNPSTEEYNKINENGFKNVKTDPLSTFSIDVDRASYSNIRRFLNLGQKVPADAVRIEEMINYFDYEYPQPKGDHPYSITAEYADCPWQKDHKLLHIGLQGKKMPMDNLPVSNIVFLLDVSGSMDEVNKLPLVKSSMKLLVNNLREKDKISIVVYAGAAGIVLNPTNGNDKAKIMEAIDNLQAGGSTAGGQGIMLAYKTAEENFIKGGNNRIVLCTDGDFNVGVSNQNELEDLITKKRESGVYLTCLGFGMGNYKDNKLETLSNKGNGNYAYIDNIQEANKTLVSEFGGTMYTIAKDVKLQVEFNPSVVQAYRLVGYENRMLNNEDFKDDKKDAGEMGAGHTVTAIYEIIPVGVKSDFVKEVDDLKYQKDKVNTNDTKEVVTIKTRYKKPDGDTGIDYNIPVPNKSIELNNTSENYRFSSSVAMFGMLLRGSEFKGTASYDQVIEQAEKSKGKDSEDYKAEFVRLVKAAKMQ